ncbi:protein phosphatase/serine/threonine protein phosphatase Stp1 [Sphingomonas guangdongensis]|uniref:Protein phosphatase/serine/threonine protein phosphatase Stp1 n=1 Tax=Sphingomonas guangdongensis TaxID=1141890 RepID=A0A285R1G0_9SPHN|nr:protein phosphatase 2C domain-containing protein [Sphingomonas guangdongensis]SOB87664.1 protein phosphatase/serine/threonine protein phosphatase Stp1 [Sphingomonas guangdongensis]
MSTLASDLPTGVRSVARSHVGRVRTINEDRVFDCPERGLWAVVDGMGGHRGGDRAAQSVIDALRELAVGGGAVSPDAVIAALLRANAAILGQNAAAGEQAGATVITLCLHQGRAHLAWAGDSRAYRFGAAVEQLTRDHSLVQELVDAGLLTPAAAERHPQANVVTRALGVDTACEIERHIVACAPGDRFLLCSDGLSRSLDAADLDARALEPLAATLMAGAFDRDGSDNMSLVLIDIPAVPTASDPLTATRAQLS